MSVTSPALPDGGGKRLRWTRDAFHLAAEAGVFGPELRLELIDGDLIATMPEDAAHVEGMDALEDALARTLDLTTCFLRVQHPLPLSDTYEPVPDVAVIRGHRRDFRGRHPHASDALLVAEVSHTTLAYDRTTKAVAYATAGTPEYWILNLVHGQLEVHRDPQNGAYTSVTMYQAGQSVSPLIAPQSAIAVADLFLPG